MKKKILIIVGLILLVIIMFFTITFFKHINERESISIDVYSSWLPSLSVPGVENKDIRINNNNSKEYKSITVNVECITDRNERVIGLYEKEHLKSNETVNDKVIIYTLAQGEIITCTSYYDIEEYSYIEWIMHYFEQE